MQNNPLISIVLPTYNGEEYLREALDAILNQTYANWELIIVNDCSIDSTPSIIQEYINKDKRIRTINNEVNKEVPASLNIGFSEAKGEYYTWTSDDNYYYPNALEKMVEFLENNKEYGMVYTCTNLEENGKISDEIWCERPTNPISLLEICIPGACFLYRADIAKKVGKYNEKEYYLNDDHEYWLRMLLITKIGNIPDICYLYRLRKGALTLTKADELVKNKINLLRTYRKIYAQRFDCVKDVYKKELLFDDFIDGKISVKDALKQISKKQLYKYLKKEFLYNQNQLALKYISKLGWCYFFRALKLKSKNKIKFWEFVFRRYGDDRGYLTTIDDDEIPFKIKRVYYLSEISKDKERAHHAHKRSKRVLTCIQGSVVVSLFDGRKRQKFILDSPSKAVYFSNNVWCELSDFKNNAIVLALVSERYDEREYIRDYDEFLQYVKGKK